MAQAIEKASLASPVLTARDDYEGSVNFVNGPVPEAA
jgi:hypothetical protein